MQFPISVKLRFKGELSVIKIFILIKTFFFYLTEAFISGFYLKSLKFLNVVGDEKDVVRLSSLIYSKLDVVVVVRHW